MSPSFPNKRSGEAKGLCGVASFAEIKDTLATAARKLAELRDSL